MNSRLHLTILGIILLYLAVWFIEKHFGHKTARTLILSTTSDSEMRQIRSELSYIATHAGDAKRSRQDSKSAIDTDVLCSLRKVSIGTFKIDSSQIIMGNADMHNLYLWRIMSLNAKLTSEPVYVLYVNPSDSI